MCPPTMRANTTELVIPSAHPSPQPKRQIDRFSHFCTAHGRLSSGIPGHVLSLNNCSFAWGIWASSNTASLDPPESITQTAFTDRFSRFCIRVSSGMTGHALSPQNCPFPRGSGTPSSTWFLGPIQVHNPNGISESFLKGSLLWQTTLLGR